MKDKVKVSLVQFAPERLGRTKNSERMRDYTIREAEAGADLIVFPEMSNVGHITPMLPGDSIDRPGVTDLSQFFRKYVEASEPVPGPTTGLLESVAYEYGVHIIVGILEMHPVIPATTFDSAVLVGPHGLVAVQRKVHLTGGEQALLSQGSSLQVHATGFGNVGLIVGYDVWFPEVSRVLALKGAEILCNICQGPSLLGAIDQETTRNFASVRARESTVYFLVCNRAGTKGKHTLVGHSTIASPTGNIITFANTERETVIRAELTHDELIKARGRFGIFRDRRPEFYSAVCEPTAPERRILTTQAGADESEINTG